MTEKKGFVGAIINDFQSAELKSKNTMLFYDSPEYDAFWKVAEELDAPVYIHPREATPLITEQMWKARPWLAFSALGIRAAWLPMCWGSSPRACWTVSPGLKIVIGHMGEQMLSRPVLSTRGINVARKAGEERSELMLISETSPYDLYRIDHKLNRARFPNMPMAKDKLVEITLAHRSSSPRRATSPPRRFSAPSRR